jgi:hypothetical protein
LDEWKTLTLGMGLVNKRVDKRRQKGFYLGFTMSNRGKYVEDCAAMSRPGGHD